ncbi:MAG: class B sortase [Clostridiales bacterium]|nr:class B sortase [Clostridiales bacterium]
MKAAARTRKAIQVVHSIIDYMLLTVIVLLVAFAGYALWDAEQLYRDADRANYAVYKPTAENEGKSFQELQELNEEVFAWISVFGTNIDYPITQGQDNWKYVNTSAEGRYSLTGSIFSDYRNSQDFRDYNSILYGHHMARNVMFGQIGSFKNKAVFDEHRYGNLYFDGKDYGIEFFAFLHTDAYDTGIFRANLVGEEQRQAHLDYLLAKAMYYRDIGVTTGDHLLLLTTCSADSTNGRDVLVGRITEQTYADPFANRGAGNGLDWVRIEGQMDWDILARYPPWQQVPLLTAGILLTITMKNAVQGMVRVVYR